MGALPPVFLEFLGSSAGVKTAVRGVETELATVDAAGAGSFKKTGMLGKAAILGLGIAAGEVVKKTVGMAGDFQQQMTRVETGAGEAHDHIKTVGDGVLAMAGQVGQATSELTAGLYMVDSAGYHGAASLNVLRTAAEGAKVGNADLKTTTDAVTTAMNAYKTGAGSVTQVMNALIGTEAEGKTNLEDLAGSMSGILPTAAAAKVGLNEVLGAMATMTSQGTPARNAATYLRQTIGMLSNPSAKAADEMKNLGLSSVAVAQELGTKGLAATLTTLTGAIEQHMGPAGLVLIKSLQGAAHNTTAFQKVLADLPPTQQTYIGALATMVGGTKSMQAALQLTGPHMADFQKNTEGIAEHVKAGGGEVEGWSQVQKNFNQRMDEAKASLQAMGIEIGQVLMPYVQQFVGVLAVATGWLAQHQMAAKIAAAVIGGILVFALAAATVALYGMAAAAVANPVVWIVIGVMALIAAIVLLAMHWSQVWGGIKALTAVVVAALVAAWDWVAGVTTAVWDGIAAFFKRWWPLLLVIFALPIGILLALWMHFHTQIIGAARTAWGAVRSTAVAAWNLIKAAIVNPITAAWHSVAGATAGIRSTISTDLHAAYNAVKGIGHDFEQVGKAIVDGIIHGVENAGGALKSKLGDLAHDALGAAKSFLGINSPSKLFADQVGSAIPEGIALGVNANAHLAHGAITDMAGGAVDAFSTALEINSPSKKFATLGAYVVAGLVDGLTGTEAQVKAAGRKIANSLYVDFGTHQQALQRTVTNDNTQLTALAQHRDAVADQLKNAQKKLSDLQKSWASEKASIASGIMQSASIITASPDESRAVNAGDVIAQMRDKVAAAQQFAAELDQLKKKGLRSDLIAQLATAGVDQAGATALALSAGSKSQIAAMNQLQGGLTTAANATGSVVANSMYGAGIKSAQGLVKGLQSQVKSIEAQMLKIAQGMQAAIKKALGIHSPSQVFADLGQFIPMGLAQGISDGQHHATTAVTALAGAVSGAGIGAGGLPGGGGTVTNQTVNVQVQGSVLTSGDQLVDVVQGAFGRFGARNSTTYPSYSR